jgi:hypothetical protein
VPEPTSSPVRTLPDYLLLDVRLLLLAPSDQTITSCHDMLPPVLLLAGLYLYYPRGLPCEDVTPAYIG